MEIQSIFLDFFDKGDPSKDGMPLRFPIVTINISKKKWGDAWAIQDEKFLKDICKRDIYRYNIFTSEGSKIASCCRLINDVELLDYASQSNSFGGSAISLGSHRVCTINFMRIALEAKDKEHFYKILDERIESTLKILKAHKELIIMLEKKGLQPFITNGWLNMKRMFSTVGIMGICECSKLLKEKFSSSGDVQGRILTYLNNKVKELATKYELVSNIEQIPGESFAVRLAKADKLLFKNINYEIYSNQFVPLWENKTLWERMDEDGKYNNLLTGGGIVHAQIGERVTSKQAEKIIRYAINANCEHFALNAVYSQCEDGHMSFGKIETCPTCGKKIVEQYTRVVGFFTNVSAWDKTRREWEFPKRTFVTIEKD
jgi:ribonucleoside-triphosphate reductase